MKKEESRVVVVVEEEEEEENECKTIGTVFIQICVRVLIIFHFFISLRNFVNAYTVLAFNN